jgi:phosphatidylinositol alpha-1,6-mannosyltransferase
MTHLLVTNDFPPKIGGIQSYLHELWRRLPPDETVVLTTAHPDAAEWDAAQPFRIIRQPDSFLVPAPSLVGRIDEVAAEIDADLVLLDPVWPLGFCGPQLERPYGIVLHGSELTVPGRLPFVQLLLRRTLRGARLVVAAGGYPASEGHRVAGRPVPTVVVPPGVDTQRFVPLDDEARARVRGELGLDPTATLVLGLSRLVPRKGFDVLIQAVHRAADEFEDVRLVIAGEGRDRSRLEQLATALGAPVTFLGRVDDAVVADLYACADLFAMVCRNRWFELEQEGFGIVFLEAAAAGVPAIAGRSGGSAEAVDDGTTGLVIDEPRSVDDVTEALLSLLDDPDRRRRMGRAAVERARTSFDYDLLAGQLRAAIDAAVAEVRRDQITHRQEVDPGAGGLIGVKPAFPAPDDPPTPDPVPVPAIEPGATAPVGTGAGGPDPAGGGGA